MLAATARYAAFLLIALVGPGVGLQRLFGVAVDRALVLPVGIAFTAGAFWASLAAGRPWLFPIAILAADAVLAWRRRGPWAPGPPLRGAVGPALALVGMLAATQYPWNRVSASGEFLLDYALVPYDTAFHVGLVRELAIGYPPQVPGVSGFPLGYHLGADLVRAAGLRWAGVDPYDSIARFDVTVFAIALLLAVRAAAGRMGLSPLGVALAGWTLVATDFSFAFAGNAQAHWWADLLRGNLLVSLALANPVVPALALALGALVALSRAVEGEGRGWWCLAAALGIAVPFFKVFLGAHLVLGLLVAMVRSTRRAPVGLMATAVGAATLALALGQGGQSVAVTFAPLDLVRVTRESLGLRALGGAALVAWSLLWISASLGLRLVGLPAAVRALARREPLAPALAAMALAAWPLGLLFRVSAPEMLEGQKAVNDAAYLIEEGGPLLWLFTAGALAAWIERHRRRAALVAAAAVVALPATVQFVVKKATSGPDPLPAPMVRAMRALGVASRPGEVVLQRPGARYPPAPVILIGRRVPYDRFTPWLTQFAPASALEARHEVVYRFFRTEDPGEARAIARELGARYVVLYGADRVRFDPRGLLAPIYSEPGARVFRLTY